MEIFAVTTINDVEQLGRKILIEDSESGLQLDYVTGEIWSGGTYNKLYMGSAQLHERAIIYKYIQDNYQTDYDSYVTKLKQQIDEWHKNIPTEPSHEDGILDAQA